MRVKEILSLVVKRIQFNFQKKFKLIQLLNAALCFQYNNSLTLKK